MAPALDRSSNFVPTLCASAFIRVLAAASDRPIFGSASLCQTWRPESVIVTTNAFVVLVAPKGLPAPIRSKIATDMAKVLADPELKARFDTFAFEPISWSAEEITRNADAKSKVYAEIVRKANISLD